METDGQGFGGGNPVLSNTNANPYDFFADVDLTTNFYDGVPWASGQVFSISAEVTFTWNWNSGLSESTTTCTDAITDFVVP